MPMTCERTEMRDRLSAWVGRHDALLPADALAVEAHVATCVDCAAEAVQLRGLDEAIRSASPHVDVSRIVAAIPKRGTRTRLTGHAGGVTVGGRGVPRARWTSHVSLAAAATVLLVLGVSVSRERSAGITEVAAESAAGADAVAALALEGVAELSDEALHLLLDEISAMPASPVAEPSVMVRPIIEPLEMP
ncbi:MAG: hypothetical protein P3A32_03100 [Gemmatimonadota bacterium]|nr:hypothetical protein [Gemmatimonadota bacterium]MDQ8146913.1 hypothetical protein [Gemmatimonadota bacterium]MDQ8148798.1 hypothetical protein [Gemmatimonadota bacterium]MDQ8157092.1 hypothetical protein [Gemmatimonadota bacterium]MDQ8176546.1 hypothetical protein [Gemmatimonadota bacterium]